MQDFHIAERGRVNRTPTLTYGAIIDGAVHASVAICSSATFILKGSKFTEDRHPCDEQPPESCTVHTAARTLNPWLRSILHLSGFVVTIQLYDPILAEWMGKWQRGEHAMPDWFGQGSGSKLSLLRDTLQRFPEQVRIAEVAGPTYTNRVITSALEATIATLNDELPQHVCRMRVQELFASLSS